MNFKDLAAHYDAWYQTPLGALAHALECEAIFNLAEMKPINLKTFLKGYRFFEAVIKRILPGTGAFIAMKANR
jgi:hypothetical protein